MPRRTLRTVRTSRPSRQRAWARERETEQFTTGVSSDPLVTSLTTTYRAQLGDDMLQPGHTLMHIKLQYGLQRATADSGRFSGIVLGIIAGDYPTASAVPDPETNIHANWIYLTTITPNVSSANATVATYNLEPHQAIEVGARRRLDELTEDVYLTWKAVSPTPDVVFNLDWATSCLLLSP